MVVKSKKNIVLKDMERKMHLPEKLREEIDEFWQKQIKLNPHLFNGRDYNVTKMQENLQNIELVVEETDYSHYLYNERHGMDKKYSCFKISGGVLVETSDGFLILGELDETTSYPRCIQVAGGGIDAKQDRVEGKLNIVKTAERELKEELNLDLQDKSQIKNFEFKYLEIPDETSHSYSIILKAKANFTVEQMQQHFNKYRKNLLENQRETEFGKLHFLPIGFATRELEKLDNPKRGYVKQVLEMEDREKIREEELEQR